MIQGAYIDNNSYRDEWIICNTSLLLAINDSDEAPRHTYFSATKENLETETNGLSSITSTAQYSSCSISNMINYLKSSNIFVIHTHGSPTGFKISNSGTTFISIADLNNVDLSNLTFALLLTCDTGRNYNLSNITNNTPVNIIEKMVICGAETVIGFNDQTYVYDCNLFAPAITSKLVNEGLSVEDAIADIDYSSYRKDMSAICVIAGNRNNKLR